jgi:hypothetical protein
VALAEAGARVQRRARAPPADPISLTSADAFDIDTAAIKAALRSDQSARSIWSNAGVELGGASLLAGCHVYACHFTRVAIPILVLGLLFAFVGSAESQTPTTYDDVSTPEGWAWSQIKWTAFHERHFFRLSRTDRQIALNGRGAMAAGFSPDA